ncbi:MAG: hypothetical protein QM756_43505 [Polyangiaceae bacterium]
MLHTIAPYVEGVLAAGSGDFAPLGFVPTAARWALLGGVNSALGVARAGAVRAEVVGGMIADRIAPEWVVAGRARMDTQPFAASLEGRTLPQQEAGELLARAELRPLRALGLGAHVEAVRGFLLPLYGVFADDFSLPLGARLDRSGSSAGGHIDVLWWSRVSTALGSELDLSHSTWLSSWGQVRYRHPCRCMSLTVGVARRVGRQGLDVGVNWELIPP